MRAAVTESFGGIDRLLVRDRKKPVPGPGEVLVRVRAAAMNPLDCKLREGKFRLIFRVKPPFVLGFDVAGEVEAVGPGVTRLQAGHARGKIVVRP
jgi:NADPH:quinone reductase-like Zn-dependent oxidoreductase